MIVAYDRSLLRLTFVASRISGSDVVWIEDGSLLTTVTDGVHSEQNMSRVANAVPSLLRVCLTGCIGAGTAGWTFAGWSGSPRYFASTMWLVAFAANTEHTITTAPPRIQ